jgi:hypothetical protein
METKIASDNKLLILLLVVIFILAAILVGIPYARGDFQQQEAREIHESDWVFLAGRANSVEVYRFVDREAAVACWGVSKTTWGGGVSITCLPISQTGLGEK